MLKMYSGEKPTDIIIADNQYLIIEGLKVVLGEQYIIKDIVNCKSDLQKALRKMTSGFLIIDYSLIDFNGFSDLSEIRLKYPLLLIIIMTNGISRNEMAEFNNLGIKNILHKNTDKEELFSCLDAASRGRKYYSGSILDLMLDLNERKGNSDEVIHLTNSEVEIVRLIAQGLTTKEIASRKFLSFHTVMTHRKNILRKLGVSNASELIMYAIRRGIIDTIEYHI